MKARKWKNKEIHPTKETESKEDVKKIKQKKLKVI